MDDLISLDMKTLWDNLGAVEGAINAITDHKDRAKIWKQATRAGAKEVLPLVKQLAPKRTGKLAQHMRVSVMKRNVRYVGHAVRLYPSGDQFYGSFQEFGWTPRRKRKAGEDAKQYGSRKARMLHRKTGKKIPGLHFAKRAAEQREPQAVKAFIRAAEKGIDKQWKIKRPRGHYKR